MNIGTFIGSTVGLECNRKSGGNSVGKLVRAEYTRLTDGSIRLQAVSGRTLRPIVGTKTITAEQFHARPTDAYDNILEARWALNLVGWEIMSESKVETP